jgi:hypothetical protein
MITYHNLSCQNEAKNWGNLQANERLSRELPVGFYHLKSKAYKYLNPFSCEKLS